jgi:hypothetical protein
MRHAMIVFVTIIRVLPKTTYSSHTPRPVVLFAQTACVAAKKSGDDGEAIRRLIGYNKKLICFRKTVYKNNFNRIPIINLTRDLFVVKVAAKSQTASSFGKSIF